MGLARRSTAGLVVTLAAFAAACSSGSTGDRPSPTVAGRAARPDVVDVRDFVFFPGTITVRQGTTLRYVNGDRAEHTVTHGVDGITAPGAAFDAALAIDGTISITLDEPGEVRVTCLIHPTMNQTVVVESSPGAASPATPSGAADPGTGHLGDAEAGVCPATTEAEPTDCST